MAYNQNRNKHTFLYKLPEGEFSSLEARSGAALGKTCPAEDLIWGSLLGDAYCNRRGCITLEQSAASAPYLFWKWELLNSMGLLAPTSTPRLVQRRHPRSRRWSYSLRFNTRTLFAGERRLFYRAGSDGNVVKCWPEGGPARWTPAALAVWFMDDGGRGGNSRRGSVIDVSCWGGSGRAECAETLRAVFHLETSFHTGIDGGVKLFIPERCASRFRDQVAPHIIPAMRYKIAHL